MPTPAVPDLLVPGAAVAVPDAAVRAAAAERLAGLATPAGALGRLGDLAVWYAAARGTCPPPVPQQVHAVVFAGDHGVAQHGVSAYPTAVTPLMVRAVDAGTAGVSVLARQHGVQVRVLDLGVDDDLAGLPAEVTRHKVRRSSAPLHLEDALTRAEVEAALAVGAEAAAEEVASGAEVLVGGDLGIGNTTPSACLVAALLGQPAAAVTGRGTGVDDDGLLRKREVGAAARARAAQRAGDPVALLAALGGAGLAAHAGFLAAAARLRTPVLLDGVISVACALVADRLAPGAAAWFAAGHRSPEPAQWLALDALGLQPLLDLGMRLGEGSGAVAAVPLLRAAAALLGETALLADVLG